MAFLSGLGEGGGTQEEQALPQGCRSSHWDCAVCWVGAGWLEGVGDLCGCYCAAGMNFRAPHLKEKVANSVQEQSGHPLRPVKGLG